MFCNKLFYKDTYLKNFLARVTACVEQGGFYYVELDQTAFFPEGGGQKSDTGTLNNVHVLDVFEKDGKIIHKTEAALNVGEKIEGVINWEERFRKMQNHSAEHVLSGILYKEYGYENVGFHMEEEGFVFDTSGELTKKQVQALELKANKTVFENHAVHALFPSAQELSSIQYRSKKELNGDIRLVVIDGVDVCACCAPHVSTTSEIGIIKIVEFSRHRGGMRFHCKAGIDAYRDYSDRFKQTEEISRALSVAQGEIQVGVQKLLEDVVGLKEKIKDYNHLAIKKQIDEFQPCKGNRLVFVDADAEGLREVANAGAIKTEGVCGVFSKAGEKWNFVIASKNKDVAVFLGEIRSVLSAKGGGSSQMVFGSCVAEKEIIENCFQ